MFHLKKVFSCEKYQYIPYYRECDVLFELYWVAVFSENFGKANNVFVTVHIH